MSRVTSVVLLRGVNVGGHRRLRMADLRALCVDAGCEDVATYVQSGNVVLRSTSHGTELAAALEARLADHMGAQVPVVVRTRDELVSVVERCPFDTTGDPTRLVVSFVAACPDDPLDGLDPDGFGDERFALDGRELYLLLPRGQGRSALATAVARTPFGRVATSRSWRTVTRLRDMTERT